MNINESDIRYEAFSGSGPGGQYRNRHANCVRAIHEPTGTVATSTSERSLTQNKRLATENLYRKLLSARDGRLAEIKKARRNAKPPASFGNAIRTYRICGKDQGVVDHKSGHSFGISVLTEGNLDQILRVTQ